MLRINLGYISRYSLWHNCLITNFLIDNVNYYHESSILLKYILPVVKGSVVGSSVVVGASENTNSKSIINTV